MASAHHRGSARITYPAPGGGTITHHLAWPLRELEPADEYIVFEWWSADKTARNVVTVGSGVRELWATIRADNQPAELKALLRAGLIDNVTLSYRRSAAGAAFPFLLVATSTGGVRLERDRARGVLGEYEVRIHMRRVDGGTFDELLKGGAA